MNATEVYATLHENYDEVLARLVSDERITKYLKKFIAEDYSKHMNDALATDDYEEAFRMVHSLKGMGMNMGFKKFYNKCDGLCEALRNGKPTIDISDMVSDVNTSYKDIVDVISMLD